MTDLCIVCGAEIPEGRQICPICESEGSKHNRIIKSTAGARQEGDFADKYIKYKPKTENAIQSVFAASANTKNQNCHGCKWIDRNEKDGNGYCCMVVRSKTQSENSDVAEVVMCKNLFVKGGAE